VYIASPPLAGRLFLFPGKPGSRRDRHFRPAELEIGVMGENSRKLVHPEGFEPPTLGFEGQYSIQLS
jgi:hypothetical protein